MPPAPPEAPIPSSNQDSPISYQPRKTEHEETIKELIRTISFLIVGRMDFGEAIQALHAVSKPYLSSEFERAWSQRRLAGVRIGSNWFATPTQAENHRDFETLIDELAKAGIIARHIRTFKVP